MTKLILSALAVTALAVPSVVAAEVDPGFEVRTRRTVHPIARILFFPILPFVELQSQLSPEKASCWNDRAGEVVGCSFVEEVEEAQASRPTPYQF